MNLKEQQYICTLARCQNLHRAARQLYITPSALSIALSNLEQNLGVSLFERNGKKMTLTFAGEQYVGAAEQMLELKERFDKEIQEITEHYKGRVRVGCQSRRSVGFLPSVIAQYEREFPNMETVVETGTIHFLKQKLENYELDFLLCNAPDVDLNTMVRRRVYREMLLLALPPCHPANAKAVYIPGRRYRYIDLSVLNGETFILQHPQQSLRREVDRILKEKQVVPGKVRELESIEAAMQFVAEGLGVGFNREGYIGNMKYHKNVNYYGMLGYEEPMDFVLAYRKSLLLTTPLERLEELIMEHGKEYGS